MQTSFIQRVATLLMVALIGVSMGGGSVSAQTPAPEPSPVVNGENIQPQPATQPQVHSAWKETTATPVISSTNFLPSTELQPSITSNTEVSPTVTFPESLIPETTVTIPDRSFETNASSSNIIDVSTPNGVTAGNIITYTYTFTNTIADGDFFVQAWWLNYSPNPYDNLQYCEDQVAPKNCDAIPETAYQLPYTGKLLTITKDTCPQGVTPVSSTCYRVTGLKRSQKGQFQIRLRTLNNLYPQSGQGIRSLAGSAKLLPINSPNGQGEDTAATLIIGPALIATKTPITTGNLYPGDQGTFKISVGNATEQADKSGDGTLRADVRPATNIVVTDIIPDGATFVSSNQSNYQLPFDPTKDRVVRWKFPGPLDPGKKLPDIEVVYKQNGGCDNLNNPGGSLTSKEYPLINGATATVGYGGPGIPVIIPLQIRSVQGFPDVLRFGESGDVQITVQNYKPTQINNVVLTYQLQKGVSFLQATPKETSREQPDPTLPPTIKWVFNIPAGSTTAPKEMTFAVKLQAGYSTQTSNSIISFSENGKPMPCTNRGGNVGLEERLEINKFTEEKYDRAGSFLLPKATNFEYYIDLINRSSSPVTDLEVVDKIPQRSDYPGTFSYVSGSAHDKNNVQYPPVEVTSTTIRWKGLHVDAKSTLRIYYKLYANGYNYVEYCNTVSATIYHDGSSTEVVRTGNTAVCVKINPPLTFTKTVDKTTITMEDDGDTPVANRTVTFRLTVRNDGTTGYPVGLIDALPGGLQYVAGSTDAKPSSIGGEPTQVDGLLVWENSFPGGAVPTIAPGETFSLAFKAIVPEGCGNDSNRVYTNRLMFRDNVFTRIDINPAPVASVEANCGKVETSLGISPNPVSIGNAQDFVVMLRNTSKANIETNLPVEVRLPSGYTYVGINADSSLTTAPTKTISGTFTTLKWTLPTLGKDGTSESVKTIRFKAKAGLTLLPNRVEDGVWARVLRNGKCGNTCLADPTGGPTWSAVEVTVDALITLGSKFTQLGCAEVGSTRTYELTISNRNPFYDYTSTAVTVTLPLGLEYVSKSSTTPEPTITTIDGKQTLLWVGQNIAKQAGAATTKLYSLTLKVTGQGSGALPVSATADSPIGAFPPRTGVVDPTVFICLSKPALWFNSAPIAALPGQVVNFEIQATNPMTKPYTLGFEYTIPNGLTYVENTSDSTYVPPQVNNGKLSWPSVTLAAASGSGTTATYGQLVIHFKMKIKDNIPLGTKITNKLVITKNEPSLSSLPKVEIKKDSTELLVMRSLYLPLAAR